MSGELSSWVSAAATSVGLPDPNSHGHSSHGSSHDSGHSSDHGSSSDDDSNDSSWYEFGCGS